MSKFGEDIAGEKNNHIASLESLVNETKVNQISQGTGAEIIDDYLQTVLITSGLTLGFMLIAFVFSFSCRFCMERINKYRKNKREIEAERKRKRQLEALGFSTFDNLENFNLADSDLEWLMKFKRRLIAGLRFYQKHEERDLMIANAIEEVEICSRIEDYGMSPPFRMRDLMIANATEKVEICSRIEDYSMSLPFKEMSPGDMENIRQTLLKSVETLEAGIAQFSKVIVCRLTKLEHTRRTIKEIIEMATEHANTIKDKKKFNELSFSVRVMRRLSQGYVNASGKLFDEPTDDTVAVKTICEYFDALGAERPSNYRRFENNRGFAMKAEIIHEDIRLTLRRAKQLLRDVNNTKNALTEISTESTVPNSFNM